MDALILPEPNQVYVIIGGREAAQPLLHLAARLALRGPLLLLDCGNRANPYPIMRELRRLSADPLPALARIRAARAFTCYQVAALLERAAGFPSPQPVLVFDLFATFYDESVTFGEARRLLAECFACLKVLRRDAPLLISARPPLADFPERRDFIEMLLDIADHSWVEVPHLPQPPRQLSLFS